ncbi:hypothetical protein E2C01_090838 [Portunus trituberculatus]|uniref:Uncharacterized protein n=1 Tax=Portunus trituberculatus TaxID=210409 RepID=A0A5B7JFU7_PORTR|nr:hypothetical protein [Portunus trituberculatus]
MNGTHGVDSLNMTVTEETRELTLTSPSGVGVRAGTFVGRPDRARDPSHVFSHLQAIGKCTYRSRLLCSSSRHLGTNDEASAW